MYSIVLATMLTTGAAAPDFGHGCHGCCGGCWGCHGCCGGCWGCCGGCWGCCGGCWGCCGGCWGCWGCCGGCWGGCYGCYGGCYGCWGTCYGCAGCYGCYGCYGGCYGGDAIAVAPAVVPGAVVPGAVVPGTVAPTTPAQPTIPAAPKKDGDKSSSLGNAAAVVLTAPANVQLFVEDRLIPRTTNEQTFRTPELEPGSSYTYTFKARVVREGKTVSYTKQVKVRAGVYSVADFTTLVSEGKDTARVTVALPADARLYVDGVQCPLTSAKRTFDTPALDVGRSYYYTLKAEVVRDGETRAASQRVLVEAGKQVTVEFKDLPVQTASR
jgi:uncharacterized protein (TIGR03000 family)